MRSVRAYDWPSVTFCDLAGDFEIEAGFGGAAEPDEDLVGWGMRWSW